MAAFIYNMTDTWDNAGATFAAVKMDVTNTASAADSKLLDLQVGGLSLFSVTKTGQTQVGIGGGTSAGVIVGNQGNGWGGIWGTNVVPASNNFFMAIDATNGQNYLNANTSINLFISNAPIGYVDSTGLTITAGKTLKWSNNVVLGDEGAGVLNQRNSTVAQALRIFNTFTDTLNYERGIFDWITTANMLTIGTQALGTATLRDFAIIKGSNIFLTSATTTVASLPAAGTKGRKHFVTDANATTFQSIVAGGGANNVPVFDDGTNWRIG